MTSFFFLGAKDRLKGDNKLLKILNLINWQKIEVHLLKINKNKLDGKTAGQVPYSPLSMFKAILLQSWHSLSDKELEEALNLRIDFMLFCGFDLSDSIPDETTICRFRNKLNNDNNLDQILFTEINSQLENLGLKVKKANMAIVDATIIQSAARPKMKILEEAVEDRKEPEVTNNDHNNDNSALPCSYREEISADPDAKWLKKGQKYYFGYKSFATVDDEGFINKTFTVPANEPEVNKLETMIQGIKADKFSGDKIYSSKNNRRILRELKIKTRIMYKATKYKPLSNWQKKFNKAISKYRFRVEQSFGTLKRKFNFSRSSYFTTRKTQSQFTFKAICLNLLKAVNKVGSILPKQTSTLLNQQILTG